MSLSESREYCVVMPLQPMAVGNPVNRALWPGHVTVCSNFRCGPSDVDVLAAIIRKVAAATSPRAATVGDDALFGPHDDVPVQLLESEDLHRLHEVLWDAFQSAVRAEPVEPEYFGMGYRPHVTVVDDRRLAPRSALELRTVFLVEIAPEHDRSLAVPVGVAELGQPEHSEPVSAERAVSTLSALQREGIRSWVIGGWGIDALAERQTREHHDLDLFVLREDVPALLEYLDSFTSSVRYLWSENRWHSGLPSAFVADIAGVEVDVHVVTLENDVAGILSEHSIELPVGALSGSGRIDGQRVACATAQAQLVMHTGYALTEKDLSDLEVLRGLEL